MPYSASFFSVLQKTPVKLYIANCVTKKNEETIIPYQQMLLYLFACFWAEMHFILFYFFTKTMHAKPAQHYNFSPPQINHLLSSYTISKEQFRK